MSATRIAISLSFVAGLAGAAQASVSGALGKRVGSVQAAAFGAILAAAILVALAIAVGRGGSIADVFVSRRCGRGSRACSVRASRRRSPTPRRASAPSPPSALMIAGQLLAGAAIDAFGWLGTERIPITATRAIGLLLLTAGAALTLKR